MITRYVNTASTAGGNGTTNDIVGANRAFASLSGANTALKASPVSDELEVLCCGTLADTTAVSIGQWTTNAAYEITIKGNPDAPNGRHPGYWSDTHYRLVTSTGSISLRFTTPAEGWIYHVDGIQINQTFNSLNYSTMQTQISTLVTVDSCILKTTSIGIECAYGETRVVNSIIVNTGSVTSRGVYRTLGPVVVANCLIRGFDYGVIGTITSTNCSVFDNNNDFDGIVTVDHCASDDGDGTNPVAVASWADQFFNAGYVADIDFRLKTTSVLLDAGVGPSIDSNVPTTDIIGDTRSGSTSSVGPFEYAPCINNALHGSTGGQYWSIKCQPARHYVKYSRGIADNPGVTGLQGETGIGLQGTTGVQGVQGTTGLQGLQGPTGYGIDGATGVQGATGLPGPTGVRGENGVLPGVTGITLFAFDGGDTSIQTGYRAQTKLPYDTVFESWETVLGDTGIFVTEIRVGTYASWASDTVMNTGDTGPHVLAGIKDSGTTTNWSGTTGAQGEYVSVNVLESNVSQASIVMKHYEKR